MSLSRQAQPITLKVELTGGEEVPVLLANIFIVTPQQRDEFILTIGQVAPLMLPEEEGHKRQERESVTAKTIARVILTERRVREFIGVLQHALQIASQIPTEEEEG